MSIPGPRIALVFPGQGSQKVGMGRALFEASGAARAIFERADRALGFPLSRTCFEGPEEALLLTATTQPAVLTAGIAAFEAVCERAGREWLARVVCAAGHSLGEYAALAAASVLEFEDAVRAVRRRGEYMQEAVPVGRGAMVAILGLEAAVVEALCGEAAAGEIVRPANFNAPDQTVVAGAAGAIDRLAGLVKARGVGRVVRLPVSAPFHCPLMEPARVRLSPDLERLAMRDAAFPVVSNAGARPLRRAGDLRAALGEQVTAPVRWVETVQAFRGCGVGLQIEFGPGRVLSGLARRIEPALECVHVEDPQGVAELAGRLASEAPA
ncbi:MAG: ACP S-malonyltransferase [Candidatus Polarisedimenticolia bacterium]